MSELKVYVKPIKTNMFGKMIVGQSYYLKSEADKVIAKKDAEIAELKKKLMPCLNGDCILTCEVVEKYGKENAELKAEIESLKASHYAESVDAGMRERRLKRALYKACANWSYAREVIAANFIDADEAMKWAKVEMRCLKKAEEYK